MKKFDPVAYVDNDGLILPKIGVWGLQKYKLMGTYCDIFTSGMKNNWKQLVYIDLFAGAGHAFIEGENKIVKTSALIAGMIPHKFTHYILCEADSEKFNALQNRFNKDQPNLNVSFFEGDSNQNIDEIIKHIPNVNTRDRASF